MISINLNIPFTTIASFIAQFKTSNSIENLRRTGAARQISSRSTRISGRNIQRNPQVPPEELQEHLSASGNEVTKRTISDELHRNSLKSTQIKEDSKSLETTQRC